MHVKLRKTGLLGLLALVFSLAAVAQASATVTVTPGGAATATTSSTSTLRVGSVNLVCTSSSATGTLASNSNPLPDAVSGATSVLSPVDSTRGNTLIAFNTCRVGTIVFTVSCDGRANIVVQTATNASGVSTGRVTGIICTISLTVAGRACTATVASTTSAVVPGGVAGRYTNSTSTLEIDAPSGTPPTNQNLQVWNSGCTSTIPNGVASFSGPSGGVLDYIASPSQTVTAS